MERTAEQIVTNEPFTVCFGERKVKVKRLTIMKAKAWRAQVIAHDSGLAEKFAQETLQEKLKALSETGPDLVMDLVQSFVDLQSGDKVSRAELEESTDEQLLGAYQKFLEVTIPNGALDAGSSTLRQILNSTLPT